jgi:coronin-1B/1C/6
VDLTVVGGGALAVIPLTERGKLPDIIPLFKGHSGPVLDTDFNPFNDSVLASASEDGKVHPHTPSLSIPNLIS